ncbi:hypothetical protein FACS1894137_19610 [Spirochaetia bacterium]|nr:hypothetical protein FACS1894137_19610 [Spirochaetia bacterium]
MNFNSWQFLVFFPVAAAGYFGITMGVRRVLPALSNTLSRVFLLGVSLFFYACWNPVYLALILFSVTLTWLSGILMAGMICKIQREHS